MNYPLKSLARFLSFLDALEGEAYAESYFLKTNTEEPDEFWGFFCSRGEIV